MDCTRDRQTMGPVRASENNHPETQLQFRAVLLDIRRDLGTASHWSLVDTRVIHEEKMKTKDKLLTARESKAISENVIVPCVDFT